MTDATIAQTLDRSSKIKAVEKALRNVQADDRILDEKEFMIVICEMFGCSARTAKEYIEIAKKRLE